MPSLFCQSESSVPEVYSQLPRLRGESCFSFKIAGMPAAKSFEAVLEHSGNSLNWIIIRIPFSVAKIWGTRGQTRVRGAINGFAFRTSLFPTGKGTHYMIVNKGMQKGGKARPGAMAQFR